MKVKEYLQRGWKLKVHIDLKQNQLEFWRNLATNTSSKLSNTGGSSGNVNTKVERAMLQILDLEREIKASTEQLLLFEEEILQYISATPLEETDKALLQMRYVGYQTWRQIAKVLGYAESYLWERHNRILKNIAQHR